MSIWVAVAVTVISVMIPSVSGGTTRKIKVNNNVPEYTICSVISFARSRTSNSGLSTKVLRNIQGLMTIQPLPHGAFYLHHIL